MTWSRQYAHLGTGNYNPITAAFYTDLSLLTADPEMTGAVHDVFNFLTAYAEQRELRARCWWRPWIWPKRAWT